MKQVEVTLQQKDSSRKVDLPYRQIHMDFHTSEMIGGIGEEFNAEEFAATLDEARVNSVTCFARCHHGMMYYDSKAFPERVHPYLANKNLLKEQIEACHKRDIKVPIYLTVQWDDYTAKQHPEWLALDDTGKPIGTSTYEAGFYRTLCVNSPYREFLKENTKEVLDNFDTDGLFFDIVNPVDCSCRHCQEGMKKEDLNPISSDDRKKYAQRMINEFKEDMTSFIRELNQDCTIFYNRGHIGPAHRPVREAYTHFELESLPSGHWGYMHFPITMRYARNLGLDSLGMTGKFHTLWGDFHSFKNQAALEFEVYHMLALNAKCSIGDQLDPNGKISKPVYDLIGSVYSEVEKKEKWCKDAVAVCDIGVFTSEEFVGGDSHELPQDTSGVTRMLQEASQQFDIIDSQSDLSDYKVVILPDYIQVDETFGNKLRSYINNGGKVIASYQSGLNPEKTDFYLEEFGVKLQGEAPYSPDFIIPENEIGKGLPETEHVMYMKGLRVLPSDQTDVLSGTVVPYFNRTWEHFCSHRHTPSSGKAGYPAIVKNENVIYFSHPIFTQYDQNAPRWIKQIFVNALSMLLPEALVKHDGPSTLLTTLNEQKSEDRQVLHLLHYIPERRSKDIDIIEDVIPLYNIQLSINSSRKVKEVISVPEGAPLHFTEKDGRVEFIVPKINGHQMVAIEY